MSAQTDLPSPPPLAEEGVDTGTLTFPKRTLGELWSQVAVQSGCAKKDALSTRIHLAHTECPQ